MATPGQYTFQQNNALIHVSKTTMKFINEHKLKVMKWPANSPDLNLIEHLWSQLKAKFHKAWEALGSGRISRDSGAMAIYVEMLKRIWKEELAEVAMELVKSMSRRIKAVIKAKGGHTKY